jgi:drug/metabolite transporter (DMT)-like permease
MEDWASLLFLVLCWGSTFALTKVALESIPPLWIVALRLSIGASVVVVILFMRGENLPRAIGIWKWLVVTGAFSVLPFFFISWGTQHVETSLSAIIFGVGPLMTIAMAHFVIPGERLTISKVCGFTTGFLGLIVLFGPSALGDISADSLALLGQVAMVAAAAGYSIQGICGKLMPDISLYQKSAGTFLCAAAIAVPLAVILEPQFPFDATLRSLTATATMGVFATALAGTVMFFLIRSAGPTFLSLAHYLIPLYALAIGIILLGEKTSLQELLALGLIVSGIALSEWKPSAGR